MSLEFMTIAMFVVLIATIATGLPLAYCLAGVATLFGLIDNGWDVPGLFDMFANNAWGVMKTMCWWPSRCLFSWPSCWTAPR
jgi:TRAP-type mannitol/chloroaromatic compound transport system permease large subunit